MWIVDIRAANGAWLQLFDGNLMQDEESDKNEGRLWSTTFLPAACQKIIPIRDFHAYTNT
jgi:hypothetical protein